MRGIQAMLPANPFGPQAVNGINQADDGEYVDVDFTYVYETVPVLAALEERRDQTVPLQNDADFELRAISFTKPSPVAVGIFRFRLSDSQGYYLSNSFILEFNLSPQPQAPTPVLPGILFPRGGAIGIDIQNTDPLLTCQVQIAFRGVKRYRIAKVG